MTFLDVSSLQRISKTQQITKMVTRADCLNKTKAKNGFLEITNIQ